MSWVSFILLLSPFMISWKSHKPLLTFVNIFQGPLKAGGGDSWMSPINRQFSNMGLLVRHNMHLQVNSRLDISYMMMMMSMMVAFSAGQNDDPSGPNIDLAPGSLQEKKMDVEKRGLGINDYNGDMRKGGRVGGGMPYRPPVSKEAAPGDAGSYYDKVMPFCPVSSLRVLCLSHVWITFCPFSLFFISSCGSTLSSWCTPFLPISPSLPASTPLKLVSYWLSL